ncbi:MAG: hypothetical protein ILN61_10495, partial [Lachnospiraceae bacterium]|nr:hypothetical protein [Lachnospiraceae bacterium]
MGFLRDYFYMLQQDEAQFNSQNKLGPLDEGFIAYKELERRVARRRRFFKNTIEKTDLTSEQVLQATVNAIGQEAFNRMEEEINKTMGFKGALLDALKKENPDRYNELQASNHIPRINSPEFLTTMKAELPKERYDKVFSEIVYRDWRKYDEAHIMEELEKLLSPEQIDRITETIGTHTDPSDLSKEEQTTRIYSQRIGELRANIPDAIRNDPAKLASLQSALDFADSHLTLVNEDHKTEKGRIESDVQSIESNWTTKIYKDNIGSFKEGKFNELTQKTLMVGIDDVVSARPGKDNALKELFGEGVKLSPKTEEGIRKIFAKFDEMNIIPDGTASIRNVEQGNKVYSFVNLANAKQELTDALDAGDYERIIEAKAGMEKAWNDMEELYAIAKECFPDSPNLFPGNLDGTRNSLLSWEFISDTQTNAKINSLFIAYNQCKLAGKTVDDFVKSPATTVSSYIDAEMGKYSIDGITAGKNFEECIDILAEPEEYISNLSMAFSGGHLAVGRPLDACIHLESDQTNKVGNVIVNKTLVNYTVNRVANERAKLSLMSSADTEESKKVRNQAIENLITVSGKDVKIGTLFGIQSFNGDGSVIQPVNADAYVKDNPVDYEGMISRTNIMINKFSGRQGFPSAYEIRGAAYQAYVRVLDAKRNEKGTPGYDLLENESKRLYQEMISAPDCPESVKDGLERARGRYHVLMREYLSELKGGAKDLEGPGAEKYASFLNILQTLVDNTDPYFEKAPNGTFPSIDPKAETIDTIIKDCENVIKAAEEYKAEPEADTDVDRARRHIINQVQNLMGQDLNALHAAKNGGLTTMPEIIDNARTHTVDLGDQQLQVSGANMSTRIRMTIPGPDGKPITGFFTESSQVLTEAEEEAQIIEKMKTKYPDIISFIDRLEDADEAFRSIVVGGRIAMNTLDKFHDEVNADSRKNFFDDVQRDIGFTDAEIEQLNSAERSEHIAEYIHERAMLKNKHNIFRNNTGMQPGDNIDKRNSAMTAVANVLGMGDVIAPSMNLKVTVGGRTMSGTFMAFAKGQDVTDSENDLSQANVYKINAKSPINQIADLNVLDYICGNLDRHAGNIFYDFDKETGQLKSVQGIDNDLSFGRIEPAGLQTVNLENIPVMSEKTADAIMNLDIHVLKTMLRQYDLPEESLKRAGERLASLQAHIVRSKEYFKQNRVYGNVVQGYTRICSDKEMEKLTIADVNSKVNRYGISTGLGGGGAFDKVSFVAQTAVLYKINNIDKQIRGLKDTAFAQSKELSDASRGLEAAKKNTWFGTKEYDNMAKGIRNLMAERENTFEDPNMANLRALKEKYAENKERIQTYLDRKAQEKNPSEASRRRQAA